MNFQPTKLDSKSPLLDSVNLNAAGQNQPSSPGLRSSEPRRKIAIAVDLSDESAYAVRWAIENYIRPYDFVFFLHVQPTSVFYGADWGSVGFQHKKKSSDDASTDESEQQLKDDFENFTATKASILAQPLVEANIPFKIHIVKDRDMKERLCLEAERLRLNAVIMGSRGSGASKQIITERQLGTVSLYCVQHCVCPVLLIRYPDPNDGSRGGDAGSSGGGGGSLKSIIGEERELDPVPEDEQEYHDADDELKEVGTVAKVEKTAK